MPMKVSLALAPRRTLSRQTAWGCLTSNLAMPGTGSLLAGHASGYVQLTLALIGLLLTVIFGSRFIFWQITNWSKFHGPNVDPYEAFPEMWLHVRWALLGFALFFFSILWSLTTSLFILRTAKKVDPGATPPILPK